MPRSFFNKAGKLSKSDDGKGGGEGEQKAEDNEVMGKKGRKRKEDGMEDSCRYGPVTDGSESPVRKRKPKRRRVIIDSDDEEEKGEEERGESEVCGTHSCREGEEEKEVEGKGVKMEGEETEEMKVGEEEGEKEKEKVEGKGQCVLL